MHYDVIICGLGPTGGILANLLGLKGISVLVLERDEQLYYAPRAVHYDDEAMRVFQAAGLSEPILNTSETFREMEFIFEPSQRSVVRLKVGTQDRRYGYDGAFWFHQPTLEGIIREGLSRFPQVEVRYGADVVAVSQTTDSVTVSARCQDGEVITARGTYLVGCDGGKSFIRKSVDIPLKSADFNEPWVVVNVKTKSGHKDPLLPPNHRQYCYPDQPVTYVPMPENYYRWEFMDTDGTAEQQATEPAYIREKLRPFVDPDTVEVVRSAYYKFHAFWATRWHNGRIILAGDAAHQMPPFLGQGMCSGLRDASSLAWRLHLMLKKSYSTTLLDTYQSERTKHVLNLIEGAMLMGNIIQTRQKWKAVLRNWLLFRPLLHSQRFRELFMKTANRKRPLETGIIGSTRKSIVGTLMIQPRVNTVSQPGVLLQDVLGYDFSVLARKGVIEANRDKFALLKPAGCNFVTFERQAGQATVGDRDAILHNWFDAHTLDFVIIRPDQYIFDGGAVEQINDVVQALCAHTETPRV